MTKRWQFKSPSPHAPRLAREADLSLLEAQLLIHRGISTASDARSFLSPRLSHLTDPTLLKDIDRAVDRIIQAIKAQENITIYGDYDADGMTATALLLNFFKDLGLPVSFYIPNRFTQGYGLHPKAIEDIARQGGNLMITVDCGTSDLREITLAQSLGLNVVVTDHHQVPENYAPLCPVVNPHRADSAFPFPHLAGVGIAFFLAIAVRAALREKGWFKRKPETDLRHYLDLVALGTVADMVPLVDQNRIMVKAGLEKMGTSSSPGIQALRQMADMESLPMTSDDVAFRLAPPLNASGRMADASLGVLALTADQPRLAFELAGRLSAMNRERQHIERTIVEEIETQIAAMADLERRRTLVFSGKGWHKGVIGIVASKIAEKYHRPTLVLDVEDGWATGSGRSIPGFNIYRALGRLGHCFEKFGGHHHAVGFTLKASQLPRLGEELENIAQRLLSDRDPVPVLEIDAEIGLSDLSLNSLRRLTAFQPFGPGNPEPLLAARSLQVVHARIVGENHLKMKVKQAHHVTEAIGFNLAGKAPRAGETVDLVFTPEINAWQGCERVQLKVVDLTKTNPVP
jgi:single-stranded-DNA-specific exonuclease